MKIAAVLLAGGESRRMGRDKATIFFNGRPLWEIQLNLLRKLDPSETFISAREDPEWRPPEFSFVPDAEPSRGPLSGIAAALARTHGKYLLVLAIDMPFMNDACLRSICSRIEPQRGVVPMIGDRAEPLAAIYPAEARSDFSAALGGTDFSLQTLIKRLVREKKVTGYPMPRSEEHFFRNLNVPADLQNLAPS